MGLWQRARWLVVAWPVVAAAQDPNGPTLKPKARFEFQVDSNVMVPMRDGVRLATDLYRPQGAPDKLPVVLIRTPYDKSRMPFVTTPARFFAEQGFVVAAQDIRGKFASEGEFFVQMHDHEDGYDTIDWIVKQPWSSGKVGTYGCSYMGEVQLLAAKMHHPNHTAMIAQSPGGATGPAGGYYTNWGTYEGGTLTLSAVFGWMGGAGSKEKGKTGDLANLDFAGMLKSLPVATMASRANYPQSDFADFVTHPPADPYWERMHYIRDDDHFEMPILWVNSWFDVTPEQTMYLANLARRNARTARARDHQYVIMSPTAHCLSEAAGNPTQVGDRSFGDARLPYFQIYLDWFDHWLRDRPNPVIRRPHFQYYQMGSNTWRSAARWPVPGAVDVSYYLTSRLGARTGSGDGRLTTRRSTPGTDHFIYDPDDPLPSLGGTVCCTGNPKDQPGAFDQRDLERRPDVLVYSTAPLVRAVEVTGSVRVRLYVSVDTKDSDLTAKLIDVDKDGRAWNVANGALRLRYRDGMARPKLLEPGQVYPVEVRLKATAHTFLAGHRIRLWVSGSDFPLHDRNLNTGGDNVTETTWKKANITIHHGPATPSALLLPVVNAPGRNR